MRSIELNNGYLYPFDRMKVMGILNATPDSFYSSSRVLDVQLAVERAMDMIHAGADILDIGGESTRPGSDPVSSEEEIQRIVPVITEIRKKDHSILISVDTYHANTADVALAAGGNIINDISGLRFDASMAKVAIKHHAPVIIMHMKGTPKNMQINPHYDDVVKEVMEFFQAQIQYAISQGIPKNQIILDPGIGFGKNYDHNIALIRNIQTFHHLDYPMMLAVSRKAFIGKTLGDLPAADRLEGTIAISCFAAERGIEIIRVHDVLENLRAIRMIEALQ